MIYFEIAKLQEKLSSLEAKTYEQDFWQSKETSEPILKEIKIIKSKVNLFNKIQSELINLIELNELLQEEVADNSINTNNLDNKTSSNNIEKVSKPDISGEHLGGHLSEHSGNYQNNQEDNLELVKELLNNTKNVEKDLETLEIETLFTGKYDTNNAIITLHSGAGGTEAQDWVEMLYRMYTRWAVANNFQVEEIDYLEGDGAGIKSVTAIIKGEYAYGYLKSEIGVHRLVRISPFDAGGRRHTSFASVEVLPEITDDIEVDINPDDLRIDIYRASGAGGQHVNKTSSAIRITHLPTNVVVTCQTERSQLQNRETAMKMLKSKLYAIKEREHKEHISELKGEEKEIAWGSQIRSYVFCPYTLVKDHRTNYETGNVQSVMDGNITGFMKSYLGGS